MLEFRDEGSTCFVSGELSQAEVIRIWPMVDKLVAQQVECVDLSGINYSDTAGVAMLLHIVALQHKAGGALMLCRAPLQLQKLIDLYDLQDFFVEEAN
ncbi:STAS domain-containing protein [Shewanella psychrotolerans]|uniref:STAS domain-containing protein n=1 Tax=Shewanella psychrotolerans TaxID=2864206 RepID=UPI001C660C28|nr:STAS domain-containing protein [Shewanella psychrotolerans]QYK01012.1 STAS domain-containing protein [Shewanella psychrotolerans]